MLATKKLYIFIEQGHSLTFGSFELTLLLL